MNNDQLRGHSFKIANPNHWRTTLKVTLFAIRVTDIWNSLPENNMVTVPTITTFKTYYDRHLIWMTSLGGGI